MAKWLTALVLIVTLGGNALAGFSMHPEEKGCKMPGCCETARSPEHTPETYAARTCCALNCPQPAPTGTASAVRLSPLAVVPAHPAAVVLPPAVTCPRPGPGETRTHLLSSKPTYIRHLALLI